MTVLRADWGAFLEPRRSDLSKMIVLSVGLHVFLFLFVLLNQFFFALDAPKLHGFQVNLVAPSFGPPAGGGEGGALSSTASKPVQKVKSPPTSKKKSAVPEIKTEAKVAPKAKPVKAVSIQPVPKVIAKPAVAPKVVAPAAIARPPRASVKPVPVEDDDPDRLDSWWKNQKKSLKLPKEQRKKLLPAQIKRKRTAKIDIASPPISSQPVVPRPRPNSNAASPKPMPVPVQPSAPLEQSQSSANETGASASLGDPGKEASAPDKVASVAPGLAPGPPGVGVVGGGSSFRFPGYLQKVDHKIRWQWAPPPSTGEQGRLIIRFVIEKNGRINKKSIAFEERSGSEFFDQAGMRALYAADPLPPLPDAYKDQQLLVYINFSVTEVY